MKRRLGLAAAAIGSILAMAAPQTAVAGEFDHDHSDRGYYNYHDSHAYMTPHERAEYARRLERERKEQEKARRQSQKAYSNGYNSGYSNGFNNGYSDQNGYWRGYR